MTGIEHPGDFELPAVQPVTPEVEVPGSEYRPEIGDPVLERLRREDGERGPVPSNLPDVDKVIERKKQRNAPIGSDGKAPAFLLRVKDDLAEATRSIETIAARIGSFGEQGLLFRVTHHSELTRLQKAYSDAIREQQRLEELLHVAERGVAGDGDIE